MPSVSVIVCTRNRADNLRQTLDSIAKAVIPVGWEVEFLVIDNNSGDHTRAVVDSARLKTPRFRYVHESTNGKCHAYAAGLRESSGEILLFTDDDVRVPPNWIEGMSRLIVDDSADAVAGGIVFPPRIAYLFSKKPLIGRRSWFASSDYLDPDNPRSLIGANMAFHRRVLKRVPGFDVELGPGALGFGDEFLFAKQLIAEGYRIAGAFEVAVEHHFDVSRTDEEGLLDLARKRGRTSAFIFYHWEHRKVGFPLRLRSLYYLSGKVALFISRFGRNPNPTIFGAALRMEEKRAFLAEYLAQRRRPRKYSLRGSTPLIQLTQP